jgi:Tfp pilus assembly protein PilO
VTGTTSLLVRRIAREHRRIIVPLVIALLVNVAAYALVVYPLSQAVGSIEQREAAAVRELDAARQEHAAASGTLTGKDRAARELERFYAEVLPRDFQAARRLTHARLPMLADQLGLEYDSARLDPPASERESSLARVKTTVELAGSYADIRTFVHQLETAPEFVVIDTVRLAEVDEESGMLDLTVQLSTYFRTTAR